MTKFTVVAALIAAAAYSSEASASRGNAPSRQAQNAAAASAGACVRAPNVGAFASAPYTSPPCMPEKSN
jgi:hypothetical protein